MQLKYLLSITLIILLVGLSIGYVISQSANSNLKNQTNKLKNQIEREERIQFLFISENNKKKHTIYLASFEPISNRFSAIYINPNTKVMASSLTNPRSLENLIKQYQPEKIQKILQESLSLDIHYFLLTEKNFLAKLIDALGGVKLTFPFSQKKENRSQGSIREVFWIDGKLAHDYAFKAYKQHGQLGRRFRHKTLFIGILNKLKSHPNLYESQPLIKKLHEFIKATNLNKAELKSLSSKIKDLHSNKLKFPATTIHSPDKSQKNLLNPKDLKNMLPKPIKKIIEKSEPLSKIQVQILNGSGYRNLAGQLRDRLQPEPKIDVVEVGNADRYDYSTTQIIARNENPRPANRIRKLLQTGEILSKPSKKLMVDVTIIAGKDMKHLRK